MSDEVAKRLHGDDGAGDGVIFGNRFLLVPFRVEKDLQGFPGAAAEIGEKLPVVQKVTTQDLRDADTLKGTSDEMPVRDLLEDIHAQPLPEFHHQFLMAGWAEMTPHAGEGQ